MVAPSERLFFVLGAGIEDQFQRGTQFQRGDQFQRGTRFQRVISFKRAIIFKGQHSDLTFSFNGYYVLTGIQLAVLLVVNFNESVKC